MYDTLKSIDYNLATVTVVDDCSIKLEGFEKLKNDFPNVHFIWLKENSGPGAARQKGIELTYNPYIMFIDAGDCIAS